MTQKPHHTWTLLAVTFTVLSNVGVMCADPQTNWTPLFDSASLNGWRILPPGALWSVDDGCLVARGESGVLFYEGAVADHDFRNFELEADIRTEEGAACGMLFHVQDPGNTDLTTGYEVRIDNSADMFTGGRARLRTGSLSGVRDIYRSCARDNEWVRVRLRVVGNRIQIWVNDHPTVDYLQPAQPPPTAALSGRVLDSGSFALRPPAAAGRVAYRRIAVRPLADDADPGAAPRASDSGYGIQGNAMDLLAGACTPLIDFHVHMRGGMTVEKAMDRQAVTGINIGLLRNQGRGWPLETDAQLLEFLDSVQKRPIFVGIQVNDRDWHTRHAPQLLERLDYVLADTMIMPMPDDDSPPVKLFQPDQFTIDDPEAWMERYVRHNLRVLAEPIDILANPTWLPESVEHLYDRLWTDERMRLIIEAAVSNGVALEINANSGYPRDRFIRLARPMGVKFTFGSNNFDDRPHDMSRCLEAIDRYQLTPDDMYVPAGPFQLPTQVRGR